MEKLVSSIQVNDLKVFSYFLRKGKIVDSIQEVLQSPEKYFFPQGTISELEFDQYIEDSGFYIEGGLVLASREKIILGYQHWDLVDQLWGYFINGIYEMEILEKKQLSFFFPDQPVEVKFKDLGKSIQITIAQSTHTVPKLDFYKVMIQGAHIFFVGLNRKSSYPDQFSQIEELMGRLGVPKTV